MKLAGAVGGDRGHPETAEIVGALAAEIEADQPDQPAQRQRQPRRPQHLAERRHLVDRRRLGVPDQRIDLGQRHSVRGGDFLRQHAILAVLDARDRDHRDAARQFIEMRPRPFDVERAQHRLVLRHQRERLDEDRRPAGRLRGQRAGLQQSGGRRGDARSETKGTRIDACMRSATRRRGSEIFRTVPRIVPLKFPQIDKQKAASRPLPARQPCI